MKTQDKLPWADGYSLVAGPISALHALCFGVQLRELGYIGRFVKSGRPAPKDIVDGAGKKVAEGMLNLPYLNQSSEGDKPLAAEYRKAIERGSLLIGAGCLPRS